MRALVTGASGFVGRHLVEALIREGVEVLACCGPQESADGCVPLDLGDERSIQAALDACAPAVVFHLAARSFVPDALADPMRTYDVNAMGCARLARAVRARPESPRVLFTSSAEVYGRRDSSDFPLRETLDTRPANPYGASKAAAEAILMGESRSLGLDVVVARAFNHIGPGQSERFVVASFAGQLARIAEGGPASLRVGNLSAARDFLDVRDVVAAYIALARDGTSGNAYNVCSGKAVAVRDLLRELILIARVPVEVVEDASLVRTGEAPLYVGDAQKLRGQTGWSPQIPLVRSLRDVYEDALARARAAGAGNPSGTS